MQQEQSAASQIDAAIEADVAALEPPTSSDFKPIYGGAAIAKEIDKPLTTVYHMLKRGRIPAQKLGKTWVSTRGALRSAFEK